MLLGSQRQYYPLPATKLTVSFPCLVRAYKAGEDMEQAIPVDVVEWHHRQEDKALILAPGRYTLLFQDEQGKRQRVPIRVPKGSTRSAIW